MIPFSPVARRRPDAASSGPVEVEQRRDEEYTSAILDLHVDSAQAAGYETANERKRVYAPQTLCSTGVEGPGARIENQNAG